MADTDEPVGWEAIDAALTRVYGRVVPMQVGYEPPEDGEPVLQACSAFAAPGHWHYVTQGLSELYRSPQAERSGSNLSGVNLSGPNLSGWGIEVTMRVVGGHETPLWPFAILHALARRVHTSRTALRPGDRVDLRRPITGHPVLADAPATEQTVLALTVDPQLGVLSTANGQVTFLQAVGVTRSENERMAATSTEAVLARMARSDPLLVLDPRRA